MENGKEIDIFIPTLGFGIEYNGNYYHSSAVGKASDYHARKTLGGIKENKGILHVFTDEVGYDFTKFANYVKEVMRLYNIVNHLDANPADKQRMRFDPYKARQLSVAEGRAFVLTYSITYMSEAVLNAFGLFIGVYDQHKSLVAVLYGKPGAVYGVAMVDTLFNLTVGLHRYSQHAKTLKYYAPLRDPMACLLQRLHTQQLGFDAHSSLTPDDLYGGRVEATGPVRYGLTKATTISPSLDGCEHTIYDCGWVSVRLK
jgi:hypothetical protein